MGQQGKNFGEKWLEMALAITLTDNGHSAHLQLTEQQLGAVQSIAGRTLSQLESDGLFVFPGVKKSELSPEDKAAKEYELGHHDDPHILTLSASERGYQLHTNNLVGFVGCNDVEVTISSRFTGDHGPDFFLHYLMQKALRLTAIELPRSLSPKEQILRLLPLLFPAYLMRAFSQGIFKQYLRFEHNDSRPKGTIDLARHVRFNLPFVGKIAYSTREFSCDNPVTELIRHTYEVLKQQPLMRSMLSQNPAVVTAIKQLTQATPNYRPQDRRAIINANVRPCHHPLFTAYRPLQQLCLLLLRNEGGINFAPQQNKVFGVLFDISYLWEEYLATLPEFQDLVHPKNNDPDPSTKLYLAKPNALRYYPDFYLKREPFSKDEPCASLVVDAKYKNYAKRSLQRPDVYQLMGYMYALKAQHSVMISPVQQDDLANNHYYQLKGYGGSIRVAYLPIPQAASSYEDFSAAMQRSEEQLNQQMTTVRVDISSPALNA